MALWNPWHGCHKLSAGCKNCYVYRIDEKHGKDSSVVTKTKEFNCPVKKTRKGDYKITPGSIVYTCFTSDFFVKDADEWRQEAWEMIKQRSDLHFFIITKRIDRLHECIPADWGNGYANVVICCTVENREQAVYRLPIYKEAPIQHKIIICEPLLEHIDLMPYLNSSIKQVVVGGESGNEARPCNYSWVKDIQRQCVESRVSFRFRQTGARFIKDEKLYRIHRKLQHSQARKARIDFDPK